MSKYLKRDGGVNYNNDWEKRVPRIRNIKCKGPDLEYARYI